MKILLTLEGEEQALLAGLDSFVKLNGWTDEHEQTAIEYAKIVLMNYFRGQVLEYNAMKLGNPMDQVTGLLDVISSTLEVV
jgi:hypothetical protein